MSILIVIIGGVLLLALALGFVLVTTAKRADDQEVEVMPLLAALRSPSGRRFFAGRGSLADLADTLDEAAEGTGDEERRRSPGPARRR